MVALLLTTLLFGAEPAAARDREAPLRAADTRFAHASTVRAPSPWRVALSQERSAATLRDAPAYAPRPTPRPEPPFRTNARAAIVIDAETGEPLFEKRAALPIAPASMTKLMTAYMAFEAIEAGWLKDDQRIPVSASAARAPGSTMFLKTGQSPRVIDLLRGLIVQSGNDAARLLAEAIAGDEQRFAAAMTARAQELGLESARFKNATGLPAQGHRISVADLARLAQRIRQDFPDRVALFSERTFAWSGVRQRNRNPALFLDLGRFVSATGMKTGHTNEAGYCVVASARIARKGAPAREVIVVLAGLDTEAERARETEAALRWATDPTL